jgi:Protein of unknown function DUF86
VSRDERERLRDIREALEADSQPRRRPSGGAFDRRPGRPRRRPLPVDRDRRGSQEPWCRVAGRRPDIRWSDYAGLRDIIAHQYFRIQKQIIEDTVKRDLPELLRAVDELLG